MKTILLIGITMLMVLPGTFAKVRKWTDADGTTIKGELVKVVGTVAVIKKTDGEYLRVTTA